MSNSPVESNVNSEPFTAGGGLRSSLLCTSTSAKCSAGKNPCNVASISAVEKSFGDPFTSFLTTSASVQETEAAAIEDIENDENISEAADVESDTVLDTRYRGESVSEKDDATDTHSGDTVVATGKKIRLTTFFVPLFGKVEESSLPKELGNVRTAAVATASAAIKHNGGDLKADPNSNCTASIFSTEVDARKSERWVSRGWRGQLL
mmetsp:Transcript_8743/g.13059  ORF Transcript_8743/g.13059 Transcript_8743/m.13059 type:complete len:207 (+) Transcript_8743:215-835(+)